ncbi:phage tail protein, partial [Streptomyces sp. MCAF7]
ELDAALTAEVRAGRGDYVQIGARSAEETLEFTAVSPGSWGGAVQVRIQPMASAALPVLPDPQEGALFVTQLAADAAADSETVEVAARTGLDPDDLPADVWVQIGSGRFKVQVGQPADGKATLTLPSGAAHEAWRRGLVVRRVRRGNTSAGPTLRVGGASRLYEGAVVQLDDGTQLTIRT